MTCQITVLTSHTAPVRNSTFSAKRTTPPDAALTKLSVPHCQFLGRGEPRRFTQHIASQRPADSFVVGWVAIRAAIGEFPNHGRLRLEAGAPVGRCSGAQ